ncbi:hypothetical protein FRC16_003822 [Serendipita sp. 398]|nr:hypothetical protein FRC16_003822 [Serendipita sp. 398]
MAYYKTDVHILAQLRNALVNFQASHFLSVAGVTVLFYDYLLCLSDGPYGFLASSWQDTYHYFRHSHNMLTEVTYVWPSSASLPTCLYYIVRYLPLPWAAVGVYHLATQTSVSFCRGYLAGQLLAQALTYIPATWLLSIRVLALYPAYPNLRYFVYSFLILTHIAVLTVGIYSFTGIWQSLYWNRYFRDCGGNPPRLLGVALMLLIPFETLLIGLQLYHNFLHRKMLHLPNSAGFHSPFHTNTIHRSTVRTGARPTKTPKNPSDVQFDSGLLVDQSESIVMSRTSYSCKAAGRVKGKGRCPIATMKQTLARKERLVEEPSFSFTRMGSSASPAPMRIAHAQSPQTLSFPISTITPRSLPSASIVSLTKSPFPPTPQQPCFPPTAPQPVALPLLRTLYMDGSIYFLIVFSMRIFTGLVLTFATETLFYLSIFAEYALTTTAVSRLFIHLRMVARNSDARDESEDEDFGHEQLEQQRRDARDSEDEEEGSIVGYHEGEDLGDEEMG